MSLAANEMSGDHIIGFQYFFADKLKGREAERFDKIVIRARTAEQEPVQAKITITDKDAFAYRITSYNVCYTKLLRSACLELDGAPAAPTL